MITNDYTQPNSPIAQVLSGNYTLIVRFDLEGGRVEHIVSGQQYDVMCNEVSELLKYVHVRTIEQGAGGVRYGIRKAAIAWRERN